MYPILWIVWYCWQIPLFPLVMLIDVGLALGQHPNEDVQTIGDCLVYGASELVGILSVCRQELFLAFGGFIPEDRMV